MSTIGPLNAPKATEGPASRLLRKLTPPFTRLMSPGLCLDSRPMARAHKHGYLLGSCTVGGTAQEPALVFVVLRAASIEWFEDEVTARTAGSSLGELPLVSTTVVHEERRPSAPPRKGAKAPPKPDVATLTLRVVTRARELHLEADSESALREWLAAIKERLVANGADPENASPRAPPRSKKGSPGTKPSQAERLLPAGSARSDDARTTQARWLFAQEGQQLSDDDLEEQRPPPPARGASKSSDKGGRSPELAQLDATDYVACLPGGACLVRPSQIVMFTWLLAIIALGEGAYLLKMA